ncbi:hypothetical protein F5Y00DRAFT_193081 [Daldinia vernicosa]|uniref:uncharacterized protein n=1 Tax=Daldinia vernicosa TaxID=114800 RepID=UPI0020083EE1|nr:uncharacterized protein F5Y00DRAFT_193081 [Daldinia vernicosa]KAI0852314.1 hypothetical protein F5Y00DRAFT_193081 [Daldinia vernicosa]
MSSTIHARWLRQARFLSTHSRPSNPTTPIHALRIRTTPHPRNRRFQSTNQSSPPDPSSESQARQTRRFDAILTRTSRWLPKRLRPYLEKLRSAPFSHVAAFLVLHEITAAVPLLGLAYAFHRADWMPTAWVLGPWAAWAEEGLARYMRWFRKKGWFGLGDEADGGKEGEEKLERRLKAEMEKEKGRSGGSWFGSWRRKGEDDVGDISMSEEHVDGAGEGKSAKAWRKVKDTVTAENTEKGYKIGIQIAAAYAITKALLIPRIAISLWATPWLARGFVTARRSLWKKRS